MKVKQSMTSLLIPHKLGFGVKHGAEAIVHSARIFLDNLQPGEIKIKLEFQDAFNSINPSFVIAALQEHAPGLLPFVWSSYGIPPYYFYGDKMIPSSKRLPQKDPLALLFFCLATHKICINLECNFKVFYLGFGVLIGRIQDRHPCRLR